MLMKALTSSATFSITSSFSVPVTGKMSVCVWIRGQVGGELVWLLVDGNIVVDSLVMVVHGHWQRLLGLLLSNYVGVEIFVNFLGVRRRFSGTRSLATLHILVLLGFGFLILLWEHHEEVGAFITFHEPAKVKSNNVNDDSDDDDLPGAGNKCCHLFTRTPTLGTQQLSSTATTTTSSVCCFVLVITRLDYTGLRKLSNRWLFLVMKVVRQHLVAWYIDISWNKLINTLRQYLKIYTYLGYFQRSSILFFPVLKGFSICLAGTCLSNSKLSEYLKLDWVYF